MKNFTMSASPVMIFLFSLLLSYVTANINSFSTVSKVYSKSLRSLDLRKCNLTTLSPSLFSNVSNLIELDLSENNFQIIKPNVFDRLTNLEHLIINNCNLTHLSSEAFKNLGQLKVLKLAENKFTSNVNWTLTLSYLPRLEYLDLSNSNISQLPDNVFCNNIGLRSLLLSKNKLFKLNLTTAIFQKLPDLELLDVSHSLVETITESTFVKATNLRTLIMNGNDLPIFIKEHFIPLKNLVHLSLRRCNIYLVDKISFAYSTKLKYLDLSYNFLRPEWSESINTIVSLEYLNFGYNRMRFIPYKTFIPLLNLRELILSGNSVWPRSGMFAKHKHLRTLEMNDCGLFYWSLSNYTHPNLEVLKMSSNVLTADIGDPDPKKMSNLKILDLSHNLYNSLKPNIFTSSPKIEQLILKGNGIHNTDNIMTVLRPLTNLQKLDLSFNQIKSIFPDQFEYNRQLVSLNLIGNPWKCDCYVNDLWQWAKSKRNITMAANHTLLMTSSVDNNSGLVCDYDSNTSPVKVRSPGRVNSTFTTNLKLTWADYALEANCTIKNYN